MRILGLIAVAACLATPAVLNAADRINAYPLDTCAVAKSKLGSMGDPIILEHEGREIRFCCKGCKPKFEKDPAKFLASVDERIIKQQKKSYPLNTCVVSGEPLDEEAVDLVVENRLVRTCCKMCARKIVKAPGPFLDKVDEAIANSQRESYPLTTCPVSNEELGSMGDPLEMIVGGRLVRLCCKGCKKGLKADPAAALAALDAASGGSDAKKKGAEKKGAEKKGAKKPGLGGAEKKGAKKPGLGGAEKPGKKGASEKKSGSRP